MLRLLDGDVAPPSGVLNNCPPWTRTSVAYCGSMRNPLHDRWQPFANLFSFSDVERSGVCFLCFMLSVYG